MGYLNDRPWLLALISASRSTLLGTGIYWWACANSKAELHSTGNYIQYFVMTYNGKEYENECVYIHMYV